MNKIITLLFSITLLSAKLFSQGENCSSAALLTVGACQVGTPGLTQNIIGCVGTANDDSWYRFVATATSHSINVRGSGTYDAVVQLYSGGCSALVSIGGCADSYGTGGTESINATGLTIGATYYLRVYDWFATAATGNFTTCVTVPPAAPGNNNCSAAKNLTVNSSCVNTSTTSYAATQSTNAVSCGGTPDDDVWFMFTANNYTQTIQVTPTGAGLMDPVVELFSGSCGSLTSLTCEDSTFSGEVEDIAAVGLVPGNVYYIRVYDYYADGGFPFDICVSGNAISVGTQPNDEPCSAVHLNNVTADCNYLDFSTVGATLTSTTLAPVPTPCAGGSGGFVAGTKDVWFSVTVPSTGNLYITPRPNNVAGWINDGVMALYRGSSCSALTQYTCSDDYNYPGGYNDLLPYITASGLTPGETVYIRYWAWGTSSGNFGICVTSPTNDNCANALYMCDLNGYSASTSIAYTRDHPCNMRGNAEAGPTYTYALGASPTAPFGLGGSWGSGSPTQNVYIDNNSWIRFTAASPTVQLRVKVYNCWGVGASTTVPSAPVGVQMQIFSTTGACCGFAPVSDFRENCAPGVCSYSFTSGVSTYTLNANGLTIGNDYYLMVDGWNNDICQYDINAISGVQLPDIVANPPSVCPGQSSILTAPAGATSYSWSPSGATTQTILVTPGTTETYECYVGGVCGNKQLLSKTVTMKAVPTVSINANNPIFVCNGSSFTLAATSNTTSTYTWSNSINTTTNSTSSVVISPTTNVTYSVIATSAVGGCTNMAQSTVTVNSIPSLTITPTSGTICSGKSTTLSANSSNAGTNYTWSPGGAITTTVSVSPTNTTSANVYTLTGVDANTCKNTQTLAVTVNSVPVVATSNTTICNGNSASLTASGASSYTWSNASSGTPIAVSPTTTTNYTVTGTASNNCTNTAVAQVSVVNTPTLSAASKTICLNGALTLTVSGANTYTWSTGQTGSSISPSPTATTTTIYTVSGTAITSCSNVATLTVTVNQLPNITISGSNTLCFGKSNVLTGNNGTSYTWSPGSTVANSITVSPTSNTSYVVTGRDANNCVNTNTLAVTVNSLPAVAATNTTICNGTSASITASGANTYLWNTSSTNTTISVSPTSTTNYTVTGTDLNTCTNTAVSQVSVVNLPTLTAASKTICLNSPLTVTVSGASSYTWSTSQNGPSINPSPTTTTVYTVSGSQTSGVTTCSNVITTTVTVNQLPQISSTPSVSPSNCSASTGSITNVTVTGAPTLTYAWLSSSSATVGTNPNLLNQPAGTYNLFVSDGNNCNNLFGPYSIINPGAPAVPTVTVADNSICQGDNIGLQVSGVGGATFTWSGPNGFSSTATSTTIANAPLAANGVYSVYQTITGCSGPAANVTVTVNALPVPAPTSASPAYCIGNTMQLFGSSATSYTWAGPGNFTPSVNSQNTTISAVTATNAGTYTLSVTDANGCIGSKTLAVAINTLPATTATAAASAVCVGENIVLNAGGGNSYTWSGPNSFNSSIQSPTITSASVLNSGNYTVTALNSATGCTNTAVTNVVVNSLPAFTSTVITANVCNGATIQFTTTASGSNSYNWTGPNSYSVSNNPNPTITNASTANSGAYVVTAGTGSCAAQQTVNVNVYAPIVASASATNAPVCAGSTLDFVGSAANSYTWTGPNSFSSNTQNPQIPNITTSASGTYTFSIIDGNNCPATRTVDVLVNPLPNALANATDNNLCENETLNLIASGGTSFSWTGPNGFTDGTQTPTITPVSLINAGTYSVTVTDANLCFKTVIVSIIVNSLPSFTSTVNGGVSNVCFGNAINLGAGSGAYSYSWSGPNSYTSSIQNPIITNATPINSGNYVVTASDVNCSASQIVAVNVYPQLTINASATNTLVCENTSIDFTATGGGTYAWSGPNNFSSTLPNPQISPATLNESGTYSLVVTDATTLCKDSTTVLINVSTAPVLVSSNNAATCVGSALTLSANFGSGSTVNWYSDAALTNTVQLNSTTYQPNLTVPTTYTFYAQGQVGSCLSVNSATVIANFYNINVTAVADVVAGVTPLNVNFTNTSTGLTNTDYFSWNFGDATGANSYNATHVYNNEGTYNVILTGTDLESSCTGTFSILITVEDELVVVVPNVFTPNNDGNNDQFHITIKGAKSAAGYLFNRWGQPLFEWDALNVSWDGKAANGEKVPDATYFYLIKVIDKHDKEHTFPGYVLIIR